MSFLTRNLNRLKYALSGIYFAIGNDFSFRLQWYGGLTILAVVLLALHPLDRYELLWIFLGYTMILITELQNSSFELALDRLHPELHDDIGRSKDMAAGAVLLAATFLTVTLGVIVYGKYFVS